MLFLSLVICIPPTFAQSISESLDSKSNDIESAAAIRDLNNTIDSINDPDAVARALIPYLKDDDPQVRLLALANIIFTKSTRPEVLQAEKDLLGDEPSGSLRDLSELGLQASAETGDVSRPPVPTNYNSITVVNRDTINPEMDGPICSWSGAWSTNWGDVVLHQTGNDVSGNYTYKQGKIVGTISGNKLIGTWMQAPSYSPTQDAGDLELTLSSDCKSFSGNWRYGSEGEWSGNWTGTRY